jgi:hypothetical protein
MQFVTDPHRVSTDAVDDGAAGNSFSIGFC